MRKTYIKKRASLLVAMSVLMAISLIFAACGKEPDAYETFQVYKEKWEKKEFDEMYNMLSNKTKETISQKDFKERYSNIYKGIDGENISIIIDSSDDSKDAKEDIIKIPFTISMDTLAGNIKIPKYEVTLVKEKVGNKKQWSIVWNEKMIFPDMERDDKVKAERVYAKRGELYDRNGKGLAINAPIITLGIHPSKFNNTNINEMAKILDIQAEFIENKLKANKDPEFFVPIVDIAPSEEGRISEVMKLEGVLQQKKDGRIYPGGEAFGSLIGNIGPVTAEDLEKLKGKGYNSASVIGKRGLEQVYEEKLKGENGGTIYISKQKDGKEINKIEIAKKEVKHGESIKLAIDFDLQKKIYQEMNREPGAAVAVNPKNGEVLAMVSSPSFDSNVFTTYTTESQKAAWKNSSQAEFTNRFKNVYSPGSTFKLITAAIGLNKGIIKPEEAINIQGSEWQPDASWGKYKVTRMVDPGRPVNLKDAFVYSDNIYFAKVALNIGKDDFTKEVTRFGLGEQLPINYPIAKSQVANEGSIKSDVLLADSGFGQGEILMGPLHVALVYSSVVNDGNIMSPTLESVSENNPSKVWKENLISKENAKVLIDGLTAVVENTSGTGYSAKIDGVSLAGKTGTAELKKNYDDKNAEEVGWFVSMNTDNPKIAVAMVIENVKDRGGSHYVVPKVRNIMEYYLVQNK